MNDSAPVSAPASFVYATETHYDDLDGQMILHHPRYLVFVERAQQAWFEQVLEAPRFDWRNFPDMYHVVRRMEIDYLRPIDGVKPFAVELRCIELRAAVMSVAFVLRSLDGRVVYARGIRTNCKVSRETHEPLMWSERFMDGFGRLLQSAARPPRRLRL